MYFILDAKILNALFLPYKDVQYVYYQLFYYVYLHVILLCIRICIILI